MEFQFKPEMFERAIHQAEWSCEWAASEAQRILDEHLKTLPVVYGYFEDGILTGFTKYWTDVKKPHDNSRAVVFNAEPLEAPKPCEHKNWYLAEKHFLPIFKCKDCHRELKPTFEVEE